jgi:CRP-like cAMP-binding protein
MVNGLSSHERDTEPMGHRRSEYRESRPQNGGQLLNPELSQRLDRIAVPAFLPRGTVLFHDGDPVSAVYVIRKGSLSLEWFSYRMAFHQSLGPGQIAGLPAALNGTYNLTATAAEDCEMGYVPTESFVQLLVRDAWVSRMAMVQVSRELLRIRGLAACCRYQAMPREQTTIDGPAHAA